MEAQSRSLTIGGLLLLFGAAVALYSAQRLTEDGVQVGTPALTVAAPAASVGGAQVGEPAPDFTVERLGGGTLALSDYRGRPVVIHFFASWWGSFWLEADDIDDAAARYQDRGLAVLGVAVRDSPEAMGQMAKRLSLAFPIGLDPQSKVAVDQYRVRGIPTTVFVDREGLVREIWVGALDRVSLDRLLAEIL